MKCPTHDLDLVSEGGKFGIFYKCPCCSMGKWKDGSATIADKATRQLRLSCHKLFDKLPMTLKESKRTCYQLFADRLGISEASAHFGQMNQDQAELALKELKRWFKEIKK